MEVFWKEAKVSKQRRSLSCRGVEVISAHDGSGRFLVSQVPKDLFSTTDTSLGAEVQSESSMRGLE